MSPAAREEWVLRGAHAASCDRHGTEQIGAIHIILHLVISFNLAAEVPKLNRR